MHQAIPEVDKHIKAWKTGEFGTIFLAVKVVEQIINVDSGLESTVESQITSGIEFRSTFKYFDEI